MRILKRFIKKLLPFAVLNFYHYCLTVIAAIYYRHPSEKIIVIGVTGTNGKTTVAHLISGILGKAGYKVGRVSSIDFQIGENIWRNSLKMTMPGRFYLQKLLRNMVKAGCDYAVLEITSEGVKQFRHKGVNFDVGVFTNLTPEHIESHGGFENYKKAKLNFFNHLSRGRRKVINGKKIDKTLIVNGDDLYMEEFLNFRVDRKYIYSCDSRFNPASFLKMAGQDSRFGLIADNCRVNADRISFKVEGIDFYLTLPGKFNIYNALAAITAGTSQGVDMEIIKDALGKISYIPGRMESINEGQLFKVIVDYAHTPDALRKVYETLRSAASIPSAHPPQADRMICVLGSAGGGRDKWKRPELGKIAAQYCDYVILTNEDPYNENPFSILDEIEKGFSQISNSIRQLADQIPKYEKVIDRREAIRKAISLAKPHDTVIITGKGAENKMMIKNGFIPWDDREVTREELKKIKFK